MLPKGANATFWLPKFSTTSGAALIFVFAIGVGAFFSLLECAAVLERFVLCPSDWLCCKGDQNELPLGYLFKVA